MLSSGAPCKRGEMGKSGGWGVGGKVREFGRDRLTRRPSPPVFASGPEEAGRTAAVRRPNFVAEVRVIRRVKRAGAGEDCTSVPRSVRSEGGYILGGRIRNTAQDDLQHQRANHETPGLSTLLIANSHRPSTVSATAAVNFGWNIVNKIFLRIESTQHQPNRRKETTQPLSCHNNNNGAQHAPRSASQSPCATVSRERTRVHPALRLPRRPRRRCAESAGLPDDVTADVTLDVINDCSCSLPPFLPVNGERRGSASVAEFGRHLSRRRCGRSRRNGACGRPRPAGCRRLAEPGPHCGRPSGPGSVRSHRSSRRKEAVPLTEGPAKWHEAAAAPVHAVSPVLAGPPEHDRLHAHPGDPGPQAGHGRDPGEATPRRVPPADPLPHPGRRGRRLPRRSPLLPRTIRETVPQQHRLCGSRGQQALSAGCRVTPDIDASWTYRCPSSRPQLRGQKTNRASSNGPVFSEVDAPRKLEATNVNCVGVVDLAELLGLLRCLLRRRCSGVFPGARAPLCIPCVAGYELHASASVGQTSSVQCSPQKSRTMKTCCSLCHRMPSAPARLSVSTVVTVPCRG